MCMPLFLPRIACTSSHSRLGRSVSSSSSSIGAVVPDISQMIPSRCCPALQGRVGPHPRTSMACTPRTMRVHLVPVHSAPLLWLLLQPLPHAPRGPPPPRRPCTQQSVPYWDSCCPRRGQLSSLCQICIPMTSPVDCIPIGPTLASCQFRARCVWLGATVCDCAIVPPWGCCCQGWGLGHSPLGVGSGGP